MQYGIDRRFAYYTRGSGAFNFGDYLTEYFVRRMLVEPFVDAAIYRLVGSAISDALVDQDLQGLSAEARLSYWCCGARGEDGLSPDLKARCDFWGVRGPLTRKALELPDDTPLGDPGFLVPLLYAPQQIASLNGKTATMVHFSALDRSDALCAKAGADVALSPSVTSFDELERLFDSIASVDFLLTASLHGAILACALGTPFAFWSYGETDVPFKWQDTAALLGISADFHDHVDQGRQWWDKQGLNLRRPALLPMLSACPFGIRPGVWAAAVAHDTAGGYPPVQEPVGFDRDDWIDRARALNEAGELGSIAAAPSEVVRRELDAVAKKLVDANALIQRRIRALEVDFRRTPEVNFADGAPGHALLGEGWTPANDLAPWCLPPHGEIVLPRGAGWEEAEGMSLSAYLYAPVRPDGRNDRTVRIWLNELLAFEQIFYNTTEQPSMAIEMAWPIADHHKLPRDLVIRIQLDPVPVPSALGLADDDRPIGLAPLRLRVS